MIQLGNIRIEVGTQERFSGVTSIRDFAGHRIGIQFALGTCFLEIFRSDR